LTTTSTRERSLTPPEVDERTQVLLALLDEQDEIRRRVRASRDELREWRVEARKLATQIDEVRQEIRTGIVTEPAQMKLPHTEPVHVTYPTDTEDERLVRETMALEMETEDECSARTVREEMGMGIDGSSDEPDEATDPPNPYAMFAVNYPKPTSHIELRSQLQAALTPAEWEKLDTNVVLGWHPSSGQFDAVAHWARVENAHKVHATRKPTPGITLPARFELPGPLQRALATSQPKKPAKAAKKKRARKVAA
jgi:hypothetical protein